MRYIEPTLKITAFDTNDVITTSGPGDKVFDAIDTEETRGINATYAVNVENVLGLMK